MAMDDFTTHGRVGQAFSDKSCQERLGHTITPDVLNEMIRHQEKQLQYLLKLRGKRYNPTSKLCREVGIHKRYLAYGLVLQEKGNISVSELAKRLNVNRSTIHRHWSEVIRAIKVI